MLRKPLAAAGMTLAHLPRLALSFPHRVTGMGPSVPRRRVGAAPGSLPDIPEHERQPARLALFQFQADHLLEQADVSLETLAEMRRQPGVLWVNVIGVRDLATISGLADIFGIHPLAQEDIVHTHQRPKLETFEAGEDREEQIFLVARMLHAAGREDASFTAEQVSFVVGPGYLLTFQEYEGDVFEPVRERLRKGGGRARSRGADYLAYALVDVIIDHYFLALESLGDSIDALEQAILVEPRREQQDQIRILRRTVLFLRRSVWPLREVLAALMREETPLVEDATRVYVRDAYDHIIQVVDIIESFRDVLSTLSDLYLSSLSHRLNEVMKVLTVVGTIFIPLSFFAGIYGMNFAHMPELEWRYGYFAFLGISAALLLGALALFRHRGWI
jgi:magnesium transporter